MREHSAHPEESRCCCAYAYSYSPWTTLTCLQIVTAQQPGYFQYHKAPAQVKQVESQGLVAVKVKEIAQIEKEIQVVRNLWLYAMHVII